MRIEPLKQVSWEALDALERLMPQLTNRRPPSYNELVKMLEQYPALVLMFARLGNEGPIVGTLTYDVKRFNNRTQMWIEDVVVDQPYRRRGIARALMLKAICLATKWDIDDVCLTSADTRPEALGLYTSLGFVVKDTNVLYLDL